MSIDNDGDAAIDFARRLRTLHLDACKLLADLDWIPAAQCRTVLRLSAIRALLRASDQMAEPAFRHQIATEMGKIQWHMQDALRYYHQAPDRDRNGEVRGGDAPGTRTEPGEVTP